MTRTNVCKALEKAGIKRRVTKGPDHGMWRGGRVKLRQGGLKGRKSELFYWGVMRPEHPRANGGGYVKEHFLVLEQKLGRALGPTEVVHHINFDSLDNSFANLWLFNSPREHSLAQVSIQKLVKPLMKKGLIGFDGQKYFLR